MFVCDMAVEIHLFTFFYDLKLWGSCFTIEVSWHQFAPPCSVMQLKYHRWIVAFRNLELLKMDEKTEVWPQIKDVLGSSLLFCIGEW